MVALSVFLWSSRREVELKRRAARIESGQSKDDVRSILGQPQLTSFRGQAGTYRYGSERGIPWAWRAWAYKNLRIGSPPAPNRFPVEIRFGDDGRVVQIRILD
jgi:outer membrane protein assembly factor BamE (lipoprotein component of BamABCDE complex)